MAPLAAQNDRAARADGRQVQRRGAVVAESLGFGRIVVSDTEAPNMFR